MRIWDMTTRESNVLPIDDDPNVDAGVTSVAISPDVRFVAAGSLDTVVRIWDVSTGTLVERLRGHGDAIYLVVFTPDGKGLVSGSLDKTLKYWELETAINNACKANERFGKSVLDFTGHKDYGEFVSPCSFPHRLYLYLPTFSLFHIWFWLLIWTQQGATPMCNHSNAGLHQGQQVSRTFQQDSRPRPHHTCSGRCPLATTGAHTHGRRRAVVRRAPSACHRVWLCNPVHCGIHTKSVLGRFIHLISEHVR